MDKKGVYAWYFCQIAFSSVVALHKMVLLSPSCVPSKVLEAQPQYHLQKYLCKSTHLLSQLGILAHVFSPSRARPMPFATFATGAPVGGAYDMIISGVLTQLSSCVMITDTCCISHAVTQIALALCILFGYL
ncbi:hypothetical protein DFJ58DRAFT_403023 [Suillus subalutaceus]|uniref:uncharacterized protein n=1 Tax=Suillus subalutaceus TaxID=48586 RepID=UPI001B885B5A|nr:uncharacterized protein DFJ58DRAFT_403023 [Suillus subalutaceus]KAG1852805.1 hypothetical protein DFJ58DRAFT_403023 [Suillus subalutaceus]